MPRLRLCSSGLQEAKPARVGLENGGKKRFFGSGLEKDLQGKLDHGNRGVEGSRWDPGGVRWDKAPPGSWNLNSRGDVTPWGRFPASPGILFPPDPSPAGLQICPAPFWGLLWFVGFFLGFCWLLLAFVVFLLGLVGFLLGLLGFFWVLLGFCWE